MKYSNSIHTFMLVAALTGCATQSASDYDTTIAVNKAIAKHAELEAPSRIEVSTVDHVVYLSGIVDTDYQRGIAERLASKTGGVTKVVNTINLSN